MISTPTIPTLTAPKLIDVVLGEFQTDLAAGLAWLDHSFGKAQIMKEVRDGREVVFPGVYVGQRDYLKVFPDEHIGNFSFFVVEDGETINYFRKSSDIQTRFGLVIWFDFRAVYPSDWQTRTIDNVKEDFLRAFAASSFRPGVQISVDKIFERPGNVYREFTDKEIEAQYCMRPWGMIRADGVIRFNQKAICP